MDSILNSVKKKVSAGEEYDYFDDELIDYINSAFFTLNQLGVGPEEPFTIEDEYDTWDEFLPFGDIELVRPYICLRVRLLFDPPTSSYLVESINEQIAMYEFRMMVEAEKDKLPEYDMSTIYTTDSSDGEDGDCSCQ